jgi:hypothetical protein
MIDRALPDSGTKKCNVPCPHAGAPGIPDKNAYQFQGKGGVGRGLGKSGSGKKDLVPALPAAAALLIFLMFMVLFITVSPLISIPVTLRVNYPRMQSLVLLRPWL